MTSSPSTLPPRISRRFSLLIFALAIVAQWLIYSQSFAIKPAVDDWPIINEIHRGNLQGVSVFFTDSVIQIGYRPLKSLTIWWFGNLDPNHRCEWVRVLHLLGGALLALTGMLWLRELPIRPLAFIAGMLLVTLHPVLPQCLGSIDGIDTAASSALLWLGAWFLYRYRGRTAPALITSLICFFIGVGFKENLFALLPLSILIVLMFWPKRTRMRDLPTVGAAMTMAFASMVLIRKLVVRGGLSSGYNMIRFSPISVAKNAGIFATGLLFFGDSLWVYQHQSTALLALVGASCLLTLVVIAGGLMLRTRDDDRASIQRWITFFIIGGCVSSFPTILLYHVSEMYVPPMLIPLSMLLVLAIDGWMRRGARPARFIVGFVCSVALVTSILTIRHKIGGLVQVGERADLQFHAMLDHIPPGTKDKKILLLFYPSDLAPRATYSVFMCADAILLGQPVTPEYYRPGDGLRLESLTAEEPEKYDRTGWDYVLLWDAKTATFTRLPTVP